MAAHIIDPGGPNDRLSLGLETREHRHIRNQRQPARDPNAMKAESAVVAAEVGGVIRSLDSTYNCMGMVFAARRTAIEPDSFSLIAGDDGYEPLPEHLAPLIGDVAVYSDDDGAVVHVGVVVARETVVKRLGVGGVTILSQFGKTGEYLHAVDRLPTLLGSTVKLRQFWTERA